MNAQHGITAEVSPRCSPSLYQRPCLAPPPEQPLIVTGSTGVTAAAERSQSVHGNPEPVPPFLSSSVLPLAKPRVGKPPLLGGSLRSISSHASPLSSDVSSLIQAPLSHPSILLRSVPVPLR